MINRTTPTRSEVCDISTAIQLGLDALILSAETACGKYPREATRMCGRICLETE
jgi:pyruvate kinase